MRDMNGSELQSINSSTIYMNQGLMRRIWKGRQAYLFLLPLFTLLIIFCYYPPISGIFHSFFDWNDVGKSTFIGLDNYKELFNDRIFIRSIPILFKIILPKLIIGIVVPLIMAEMIYAVTSKKLQYAYRVLILLPIVAPGIVGLLIWKFIYDPTHGFLTSLLKSLGLLGANAVIDWLGNPKTVIPSLIFMGFPWIGGTGVLIYMAGIINISTEVIESSRLDGASTLRRIFSIDIPLLMGQIRYFLVFGIIQGLQDFGIQIALTSGGPGYSTYVPGYHMYVQAFTAGRMGYACAVGTTMFIVIFILSLFAYKKIRTEE